MSELATMNVEDAREYSESLAQIGKGWVRQIQWAYSQGIPEAEGLSRPEWRKKYYGDMKLGVDERREEVKELTETGHTAEQVAEILGVNEKTVDRDRAWLRGTSVPDGTEEDAPEHEDSLDGQGQVSLPVGQEYADALLADIDERVAAAVETERPDDEEPEPEPAEPLVPAEPGWHQLGEHLLYCGDSTDEEFIAACAGAALAFADPPYNAGKADWDQGFKWAHDYLADTAAIVAVTPGIAALAGFLADTTMPYRWSMAAEITNGMTAGALRFGNWICVTLFAHGSIYRKAKDHVRIPAATGDDQGGGHASRKPIRLLTHLVELFTTKGDLVIDPFLGSGTTLIAAERTGRRCIGAEIDPMHCAEIIARYWGTQ